MSVIHHHGPTSDSTCFDLIQRFRVRVRSRFAMDRGGVRPNRRARSTFFFYSSIRVMAIPGLRRAVGAAARFTRAVILSFEAPYRPVRGPAVSGHPHFELSTTSSRWSPTTNYWPAWSGSKHRIRVVSRAMLTGQRRAPVIHREDRARPSACTSGGGKVEFPERGRALCFKAGSAWPLEGAHSCRAGRLGGRPRGAKPTLDPRRPRARRAGEPRTGRGTPVRLRSSCASIPNPARGAAFVKLVRSRSGAMHIAGGSSP
jgi:hypothetical protein